MDQTFEDDPEADVDEIRAVIDENAMILSMEHRLSSPVDWIEEKFLGFVINAGFSDDNSAQITSWLAGLKAAAPEGIYTMNPKGLHITVLDWVAPLFEYDGIDKRGLYNKLRSTYEPAFRQITGTMAPFEVNFDEVQVRPETIILVGRDGGQFEYLRKRFLQSVSLPAGGKLPPNIIHSSLARFVPPAIDLAPVKQYVSLTPLVFTQQVAEFRLIEARDGTMQDFDILDTYPFHQGTWHT